MAGLAPDGGLYMPAEWPRLEKAVIAGFANMPYAEIAASVLAPFVQNSLDDEEVRTLCETAYGQFHHAAIAPLKTLGHDLWLMELFHGPTLAFKDFALQLLGLLFARFLGASRRHLTILGATSGDTGSAAIHALAGLECIDVFMLHPKDRVSEVQRRQMTTVMTPNIHNIAIEGSFDDAQALVKAAFAQEAFRDEVGLGAVNSINWARIAAQVVYYFHAASRLGAPHRPLRFAVPTGNFGDVFAGYVAAQMGLPVEQLIVATNENDILRRALSAGDYSRAAVKTTSSPSMDIQVSSNFERLLFDLVGRDGAILSAMMQSFQTTGRLDLPEHVVSAAASHFAAEAVNEEDTATTIREVFQTTGELLDPHTAIGVAAARRHNDSQTSPIVVLGTAHPGKFRTAVERACGTRPSLPAHVGNLFDREERFSTLPNDLDALIAHIRERHAP